MNTNIQIIDDSGQGNQTLIEPNFLKEVYYFNGSGMTFKKENDITYVNATEMAKHFGKHTKQWFDNKETHDFIHALAKARGMSPERGNRTSLNTSELAKLYPSLIIVVKGGTPGINQQGTWMHEDVALEFSRWLSPAFSIWCNDRIKELLKHGITATHNTIESIIDDPDTAIKLLNQIKKEREEKARLYADLENKEKTIEIQEGQLKIQAPVVKYANEVLNSDSLIATTLIAKDLDFPSAEKFNKELIKRGVLNHQKVNGCYVISSKYSGKGYTHTKTHDYTDSQGNKKTSRLLYWTEKGRLFLNYLFSDNK